MSSANRSRKYDSGYQKRKRKQRIEDLTQTQKGAMDRFIIKESQVSSDNHSLDQDPAIGNNDNINDQTEAENNVEIEDIIIDADDSFQPDIFDPRYWDSLDSK
jgi:NDP-sugar pyrophosphorylase family protein